MKIEFITNNAMALEYFKPIPAKKMIPEWYKKLPLNVEGMGLDAKKMVQMESKTPFSIKGCIPVRDYITSGYILIAHADLLITPEYIQETDTKIFWWRSEGTSVETHGHSQCPVKMHGFKNQYIKFMNPWAIKTPKGYSCLFYQPEYFMENRYQLFPAIVDTDKYDFNPINFPGVLISNESFIVKAGEPIMAVFPFKRDNWSSNIKAITKKEMEKPNKFYASFLKSYKNLFWNRKNYD
jgi:hypothetical protein